MPTSVNLGSGRTLDRRLVHRSAVSTVLLTSLAGTVKSGWRSEFQMSRQRVHRRWASRAPLYLGAEVLRQSGLAIAHRYFHVPLDSAFLISDLAFRWLAEADNSFPLFGPLTGVCETKLVAETKRRSQTSELSLEFELSSSGRELASGSGRLRCVTPEQYRVLRRYAPMPLDVQRREDSALLKDVVKESARVSGALTWDHNDPFYFDHPTDHVPGMVLIGAMTSAAEMMAGRMLLGFSASFLRFVEFEPGASVVASETGPSSQVHVAVRQGEDIRATGIWG